MAGVGVALALALALGVGVEVAVPTGVLLSAWSRATAPAMAATIRVAVAAMMKGSRRGVVGGFILVLGHSSRSHRAAWSAW
jgi:hypothetical protein